MTRHAIARQRRRFHQLPMPTDAYTIRCFTLPARPPKSDSALFFGLALLDGALTTLYSYGLSRAQIESAVKFSLDKVTGEARQ